MRRNFEDPAYKKWRKLVYTRDKFSCKWPGCNQMKKLNAHHIKSWAQYPGLRFEPNNGITLCKDHHKMITGMEEIYAGVFLKLVAEPYDKK